MLAFLARRLALAVLTILTVTTATFLLIHLAPGEPFSGVLSDARMNPERRTAFRERYGLERPLPVQFARYVAALARGDMGESFSRQRPVVAVLREALPRTFLLMGTALVVGFAIGIAVGAWQAARPRSRGDRAVTALTVTIGAVPEFWIALGLSLIFAYRLRWFPVSGMVDDAIHDYLSRPRQLLDIARHLVLPATALALLIAALVARYQRAALLEVLPQPFVRTARAKGVPEHRIVRRHALRNALLPTLTLLGLMAPALVGGAAIIEAIFAWPGVGGVAVGAVLARDYPLVIGTAIMAAVVVVLANVVTDLAYAWADPRVNHA